MRQGDERRAAQRTALLRVSPTWSAATTPPGSRWKWTANSPCPNLHRCKSNRRRRTNNALKSVSARSSFARDFDRN